MRLAHVSDLHLSPPGREDRAKGLTSHDVATAIADDLAMISDGLDLVVVSGDLTEEADPESFAAFERIFSRIELPIAVVPGNHDGPLGMRNYARQSSVLAGWDISNRIVEIAGTNLLGLDTCVENMIQGAVSSNEIAMVGDEIARESNRRLIVVMHHPPLLLGLETFDGFCQIKGGSKLLDVLVSGGRETLVLSGHVHRPYAAREGKLSCFVAGSMIAPYDSPLPFGDQPIRSAPLQDFYFIHDIGPGGRHVVTPQRVRSLASLGAAGLGSQL
jgi:3',5'-cyclic AMP phosphodiesterase CpdA